MVVEKICFHHTESFKSGTEEARRRDGGQLPGFYVLCTSRRKARSNSVTRHRKKAAPSRICVVLRDPGEAQQESWLVCPLPPPQRAVG